MNAVSHRFDLSRLDGLAAFDQPIPVDGSDVRLLPTDNPQVFVMITDKRIKGQAGDNRYTRGTVTAITVAGETLWTIQLHDASNGGRLTDVRHDDGRLWTEPNKYAAARYIPRLSVPRAIANETRATTPMGADDQKENNANALTRKQRRANRAANAANRANVGTITVRVDAPTAEPTISADLSATLDALDAASNAALPMNTDIARDILRTAAASR